MQGSQIVGMVSNLDQAMQALEELDPDLVIVDYDDQALNRDEFLAALCGWREKIAGGAAFLQSANEAIVYDRRTLAASQIDDWLKEWSFSTQETQVKPSTPGENSPG